MSNIIITADSGDLVTSSMAIADGVENPHKTVIQLIRNNINDLNEFGRVEFEMRPFETAGGTQNKTVAMLNEQQATLLLSYMRNNDIVRDFKKTLVRVFYEMRTKLMQPQLPDFNDPVIAARAWADAKEGEQKAIELAEEKEKRIQADAPKVGFYNTVTQSPGTYDMAQVAKTINVKNMGRNNLLKYLRSKGVFRNGTTEPYQQYVNQGYFKVVTVMAGNNAYPKTVVYQRGVDFIIKLLRNDGYIL